MAAINSTIVRAFDSRQRAEQAIDALRRAGFTGDQVGVAMRGDQTPIGGAAAAEMSGTKAGEGAAAGALTGGLLGGLLAVATGLLPGVGPVLGAGFLASTLFGALAGAGAGGLLGALIGLGVPEEEAHFYNQEFQAGRVIVSVKADDRREEALEILARHEAREAATPRATVTV
jgi:hypothetical protein